MKKLIILLLLPLFSQAQVYTSIGIDPKMALKGAYEYDTTPSLDITSTTVYKWKYYEVGASVEYADIDYLGVYIVANQIMPITKGLELYAGVEVGVVNRFKKSWHDCAGGNYGVRLVGDKWGIYVGGNIRNRSDFKGRVGYPSDNWVKSGQIGIIFKI